jgi:hypothetical protein
MSYLNIAENPRLTDDLDVMHEMIDALQAQNPDAGQTLYESPEIPEHRTLAAHVANVRQSILGSYRWNVPLLTQHVAPPEADDRAAALLVHASTPRLVRNLNQMSTDPELLGARVATVKDFLRKLAVVEIGQPFSFRSGSPEHENYRIDGVTVRRPAILQEVSRYDHLAVSTPFVGHVERLYADGFVSFHNLAHRSAWGMDTFELTVGKEALCASLANTVATARQHEDNAFMYLKDMLRGDAIGMLADSLSAEDFAWVEEQVSRTYAVEPRAVLQSTLSLAALYDLAEAGAGLEARVAQTKALVLDTIGELTANETSMNLFSFTCQEAARKLLILDALLEAHTKEEFHEIEHHIGRDDDAALIAAYKQVVARTQVS